MKKKIFGSIIALTFISASVLLGVSAIGNGSYLSNASTDTYTLTLNKNNSYCEGSYSDDETTFDVNTNNGNPITFGYVKGMKPTVAAGQGNENTFIQLSKTTGKFYNIDAITGIKSVKVTYYSSEKVTMYFGNMSCPITNGIALESGVEYSVNNYSYFNFTQHSKALYIDEIVLTYYCTSLPGGDEPSSEEPSSEDISSTTPITLDSVSIEGTLDKTTYIEGEEWDLTGLTVQGYYSDDTNKNLGDLVTLSESGDLLYELNPEKPVLGTEQLYIFIYYSDELLEAEKTITDIIVNEASDDPIVTDPVYRLVTSATSLSVGDNIIIVNEDSDNALSTTQNGNNRGVTFVSISNNEIKNISNKVQVLNLEEGNVSNTFAFNTGSGYLYAASSSKNYLRTETTLTNNSSWKIEVTADGVATVKAQGTNTRNWLRYNSESNLFSCYSSGQLDIQIYKEVTGGTSDDPIEEEVFDQYYSQVNMNILLTCLRIIMNTIK